MRHFFATLCAVCALVLISTSSASARRSAEPFYDRHSVNQNWFTARPWWREVRRTRHLVRQPVRRHAASHTRNVRYVAHPSGCPRIAFCGCASAIEVFKRNIRSLWLAANWFKFPLAQPAPGMVAVRRHHVFVIREVLGRNLVLAYDANSGNHKTRIWVRSLAGFSVRNPHAQMTRSRA